MRVPRWRLELFQMSRCPVPDAQMASPEAQMRFTDAQMRHQIPDVQRPQRAPSRCPEGRKSACARRIAPRGGHAGTCHVPLATHCHDGWVPCSEDESDGEWTGAEFLTEEDWSAEESDDTVGG